jgi:hypothetical protein
MGQFVDCHARMLDLLAEIRQAAPAPGLKIYPKGEPSEHPAFPCVYLLDPDEDFAHVDVNTGRSVFTFTVRLCVDARRPVTKLLELADTIVAITDVWLRNTHPEPIDQARRIGMRSVTPTVGGIAARGADFPVRIEADFRPITPAP